MVNDHNWKQRIKNWCFAKIKYLGYAHQHIRGDFTVNAKVYIWAFYDLSINLKSLSGMSGGAVLDEYGDLIGVLSGEVVRRGRVITTTINDTKTVLKQKNIKYDTKLSETRKIITYDQAFNYINENKIAKITCTNQ